MLAGLALLLFTRKKRGTKGTTTDAKKKVEPRPTKPTRRKCWKWLHWLTKPIRLEDQPKWKKEDEERAIKESEEAKGVAPAPEPGGKKTNVGCVTVDFGETAEKDGPAKEGAKKDDGESSLTGIVVKVLGAVAAGIGVTGAVVVVGGAIFWARFDALGLPATQAVAAIPRTELLAQGAQEMTIFVLIGLGAALLIALADPRGSITYGSLIVLGVLVLFAAAFAICTTTLSWAWVSGLIGLALLLALASIGIGFATGQRLLPLLVSVFIASFVFSASCAFLIVETQKFAQAIAIDFGPSQKDKGIIGIYVTATEKTLFYARADLSEAQAVGLYEVPRTDTTTYAVGPPEQVEDDGDHQVEESAKALLNRLEKTDAENPPPSETPKK